jgi:phosphatidylglycerol---prolipoprotein diacylglyceryl transferase
MFLNFNLYGLILGISILIASGIIEHQIKHDKFLTQIYFKVGVICLFFAVLGARAWHVVTDFYLYQDQLFQTLAIWHGGLSIFGGILGGVIGVIVANFTLKELKDKSIQQKQLIGLKLLDYTIFGLPIGQALGRWGNYVNQELYGLPSTGILKIFIDQEHRLPGFEQIEYYHPLFFYEMLVTGIFALIFYYIYAKTLIIKKLIGTGKIFIIYVLYYSVVRFGLDFIRIDKSVVLGGILGINQLILLIVIIVLSIFLFKNKQDV